MYIYSHWPKNGHYTNYAFHKFDKAAEFVYDTLNSYIDMSNGPTKKVVPAQPVFMGDLVAPAPAPAPRTRPAAVPAPPAPAEFFNVAAVAEVQVVAATPKTTPAVVEGEPSELTALKEFLSKNDRTLEGLLRAIALYEEYAKYVLMQESAIHTIQEVNVSE